MTGDPVTGDRRARLRAQHYYGELLAAFRRTQADIAAEQDATLTAWPPPDPVPPPPSPANVDAARDDTGLDDDFANNTWLR